MRKKSPQKQVEAESKAEHKKDLTADSMSSMPAGPMAKPVENSRNSLGSEDSILARIDRHFARQHPGVVLARGDDCAELCLGSPSLAVSSDIFLENIHFRRSYFTPEEIGHKALAVNLSDLAAAGARPLGFILNLMLPPDLPPDDLEGILSGMGKLAAAYDLPLCGGDLAKAQPGQLGFAITIWGGPAGAAPGTLPGTPVGGMPRVAAAKAAMNSDTAEEACSDFDFTKNTQNGTAHFLRRGQAQAGDYIFLIGEMGLARVGLLSLEELHAARQTRATDSHCPAHSIVGRAALEKTLPCSLQAHLLPQPQVHAGLALARFKQEHPDSRIGLMDLSDGLYRDLPRLLGKAAGFSSSVDQDNASEMITPSAPGNGQEIVRGALSPGAALHINPSDLHPELALWVKSRESSLREDDASVSSEPKPHRDISSELSAELSIAIIEQACQGGEDYALLVTCSPEYWERLNEYSGFSRTKGQNSHNGQPERIKQSAGTAQSSEAKPAWKLKKIGVVTGGGGLSVNGKKVSASGFDHFSQ